MKSVDKKALLLILALACKHPPKPDDGPPKPPDPPPAGPMTRVSPHHSTDPELSGDWLLFATKAYAQNYDIYRRSIDGKTDTLVVASPKGDERFPAVNPVSRELAFCSTIDGFLGIYWIEDFTKPADAWTLISRPGHHAIHPSWSPDGRFIVYSATAEKDWTNAQLMLYEPRTQTTHAPGIHGLFPSWAPEGNRIAFQKMRGRDEFLGGLWIVGLDGTEVAAETKIFDMDEFATITPRWSPDGARLVFAITRADANAPTQTARDLGIVPLDGSELWRITEDDPPDWLPRWSKDGRIFFVSERDGPPAVWSMAAPSP